MTSGYNSWKYIVLHILRWRYCKLAHSNRHNTRGTFPAFSGSYAITEKRIIFLTQPRATSFHSHRGKFVHPFILLRSFFLLFLSLRGWRWCPFARTCRHALHKYLSFLSLISPSVRPGSATRAANKPNEGNEWTGLLLLLLAPVCAHIDCFFHLSVFILLHLVTQGFNTGN